MFPIILSLFLLQATYLDLYQEGRMYLEKGDVEKAEIRLRESAIQNPSYVPTLRTLAEIHVKNKRFHDAIEEYERIVEMNPKDINSRGHLAELYSWIGDYEKSIVTYRDALAMDHQNIELKTGLAKVYRWSQRYDEAEILYKEILDATPDNYEALKGIAKTYAMMGDLVSAIAILDNAISLYPDASELYKEKGTVLAWKKDFNESIKVLEKAVALTPDNPEIYRTMGDVYSWMKQYNRSVEMYKKSRYLEPGNIENHILLAEVYKSSGKKKQAEESIMTALRMNPSNPQALEMLQEIRNNNDYRIIDKIGELAHISAFLFTLVLIYLSYKSKLRILKRRHKIYYYITKYLLPPLVVMTFAAYLGKDISPEWVDPDTIEDFAEAFLFLSLGASFLSLLWADNRSKEFQEMSILAVGAHPDDVELGCGGFLMKAKEGGAKVYALTLTKGEKGINGNGKGNGKREEELERAAKFIGLDKYWVMNFKDTELKDCVLKIKDVIEEKTKETGASMVLTHSGMDIHSDHQAVFQATCEAARDVSILSYEDVSTPGEFIPNWYVDISNYMEEKAKLLSFHKTQQDKTYMDPEIIKGRAAHRGLQAGVSYAEAFRVYRLLG